MTTLRGELGAGFAATSKHFPPTQYLVNSLLHVATGSYKLDSLLRSNRQPVQEVALYDPNRKPASWMEVIQPSQYAVFVCDVETGVELTGDGRYLNPSLTDPGLTNSGLTHTCLIFDSLEETEQFCRAKIAAIPNLRYEVFDSHGRANPPVATFVSQRYENKLESPAKAGRMMRWAFLVIAASFPLFWYTWKTRGEGWLASFFGMQLAFAGLRLLHWGYSMKEELRYRETQSDLRRQQIHAANNAAIQKAPGDPSGA
jgi:hypothetical protein